VGPRVDVDAVEKEKNLVPAGNPRLHRNSSPGRTAWTAHLIIFYLVILIVFGYQYKLKSFSLCIFLHASVISSLAALNVLLSTLFSNTPQSVICPYVRDQVSHPYKTTDKRKQETTEMDLRETGC
jgi:hypothetical protein